MKSPAQWAKRTSCVHQTWAILCLDSLHKTLNRNMSYCPHEGVCLMEGQQSRSQVSLNASKWSQGTILGLWQRNWITEGLRPVVRLVRRGLGAWRARRRSLTVYRGDLSFFVNIQTTCQCHCPFSEWLMQGQGSSGELMLHAFSFFAVESLAICGAFAAPYFLRQDYLWAATP